MWVCRPRTSALSPVTGCTPSLPQGTFLGGFPFPSATATKNLPSSQCLGSEVGPGGPC